MKKILNKIFNNSYAIYSISFFVLVLFILYIFDSNGKSLVYVGDSFEQHIVTLKTFREVLLNFFKTGSFDTLYWNIGMGFDMYANYAYYIFGDIFSYLSIFIKEKDITTFYQIMIFVRWYFVGISFLIYCKHKRMSNLSSVIGSIIYTFSSYAVTSIILHPYFAMPMILFPILLITLENAINKNKYILFSISIFLLYASSFYFGFLISFILAAYGIILICQNKEIDNKFKKILTTFLYSLLGIVASSFILIPTLGLFLSSERSNAFQIIWYTPYYYKELLSNLLNYKGSIQNYYVVLGVQSISLLFIPFILLNKKYKEYKYLLLAVIIPIVFSPVSSIINGLSFPDNRWTFVFPFLFGLFTTLGLENIDKYKKKHYYYSLVILLIILLSLIAFDIEITNIYIYQTISFLIFGILLSNFSKKKYIKLPILLLLIIFSGVSINYKFNVSGENNISTYISKEDLADYYNNSQNKVYNLDVAVNYLTKKDGSLYYISKYPDDGENVSLMLNYNSIQSYYSITDNMYNSLGKDLLDYDYLTSRGLAEFNRRTKILTLLGVKYILTNNDEFVSPYGFDKIDDSIIGINIYENKNYVSFASFYKSLKSETLYNTFKPLEKEEALLKQELNTKYHIKNYKNYKIESKNVNKAKRTITIDNNEYTGIKIENVKAKNSEIYVSIQNLQINPLSKRELINSKIKESYNKYKINTIKNLNKYYQKTYNFEIKAGTSDNMNNAYVFDKTVSAYNYTNNNNYLINIGYYEDFDEDIYINLCKTAIYTYDSIEIFTVSFDDYEEDIEILNSTNYKEITHKNNYVSGTVDLSENGYLQFQTLYKKGWDVYVDGKKTKKVKINNYFLGVQITKGKHTIELKYHTPYRLLGKIITLISFSVYISILIFRKKHKA